MGSTWIIYDPSSCAAQSGEPHFKQRKHDVCHELLLFFVSPRLVHARKRLHWSYLFLDLPNSWHAGVTDKQFVFSVRLQNYKKVTLWVFGSESSSSSSSLIQWLPSWWNSGRPATSVSRDARSHWHNPPEKGTAWTVKHGTFCTTSYWEAVCLFFPKPWQHIHYLFCSGSNMGLEIYNICGIYGQKSEAAIFWCHAFICAWKHISFLCGFHLNPGSHVNSSKLKLLSELSLLYRTQRIANNSSGTNNNVQPFSVFLFKYWDCHGTNKDFNFCTNLWCLVQWLCDCCAWLSVSVFWWFYWIELQRPLCFDVVLSAFCTSMNSIRLPWDSIK